MASVTQRIKLVKQPTGGFISITNFEKEKLPVIDTLHEKENVHGSVIAMVVDYMTRAELELRGLISEDALAESNAKAEIGQVNEEWDKLGEKGCQLLMRMNAYRRAFGISMSGAKIAEEEFKQYGAQAKANELMILVSGTDDMSICNACKLVTYDVWARNPGFAPLAKGADETEPDKDTIENIRIMVERSIHFFEAYGPVTKVKPTFEPNGYTKTVDCGDGDYLTADTLWDFKVVRGHITKEKTLQLLMYWIMGQHSGQVIYKNVHRIGFYNPRHNIVYTLETGKIPEKLVVFVEERIICY